MLSLLPPLLSPRQPMLMAPLLAIPKTTLAVAVAALLSPPLGQLARHLSSQAAGQEAAEELGGRWKRRRRGDPKYPTVAMATSRNLGGRRRKEGERGREVMHRRLMPLLCRLEEAAAAVAQTSPPELPAVAAAALPSVAAAVVAAWALAEASCAAVLCHSPPAA